MKIWIVVEESGQYSDFSYSVDGAYHTSEESAERRVAELRRDAAIDALKKFAGQDARKNYEETHPQPPREPGGMSGALHSWYDSMNVAALAAVSSREPTEDEVATFLAQCPDYVGDNDRRFVVQEIGPYEAPTRPPT